MFGNILIALYVKGNLIDFEIEKIVSFFIKGLNWLLGFALVP